MLPADAAWCTELPAPRRRDLVMRALAAVEAWHRDPAARCTSGAMTRKSPQPRQAVGNASVTLRPGMSRLATAELLGGGAEGVALRVHQADYVEPVLFPGGRVPRFRTVVKLRRVETRDGTIQVIVRQTVARELTQGIIAAWLHLPFIASITHWWLWAGDPVLVEQPHHVAPHLRRRGMPVPYDITDLMDAATATAARRQYVVHAGVRATPTTNWDAEYLELRTAELRRAGRHLLPLVVIEQPNAGDTSLWELLRKRRLLCHGSANWRFVRAQLRLVAGMVAHLQEKYRWIHGDLSLSNIVMTARDKTPDAFALVGAALDGDALRLPGAPERWLPTFADLSRSAIHPALADAQFAQNGPDRSPSFFRDAIAYVDGFGADGFSHTADMRRLGLSLCQLIAFESCAPRAQLTVAQLDTRIVRTARLLLDVPAAWADVDFAKPRSNTDSLCTARLPRFQQLVANILWLCDYMEHIERGDRTYTRERYALFDALATEVSLNLNPYSGWLLERHPALDADDIRRPALVARWDVLCAPL
jgi:hypothetical protein